MTVIIVLLILILLCMFKPIRQLVGLLVLFVFGAIWWSHHNDQATTAEPAQQITTNTDVVPLPKPRPDDASQSSITWVTPPVETWPAPATGQFSSFSDDEKAAVAFAAALAVTYLQCDGKVSYEAASNISAALRELGPLVDKFAKPMKRASCVEIRRAYETGARTLNSR